MALPLSSSSCAADLRVTLNNGRRMPQLGLGTWRLTPEEAYPAVLHALKAGYRLIDTAVVYHNEEAVGNAIRDSGIPREEVFLTTKLHPRDHGAGSAYKACIESLERLGMDYVDLYLIHWPGVGKKKPGDPKQAAIRLETWKDFERLVEEGKCKSIGVSNYLPRHLDELFSLDGLKIPPAVNQFELSPYHQQPEIQESCKKYGVFIQSYSTLASGGTTLLDEKAIVSAAEHSKMTPAQVCLRWALQHGFGIIPKSRSPARITENAALGSFSVASAEGASASSEAAVLSEAAMASIDALEKPDGAGRTCWDPNIIA
jgi:2,5-diketo-D-gluconate reductase A